MCIVDLQFKCVETLIAVNNSKIDCAHTCIQLWTCYEHCIQKIGKLIKRNLLKNFKMEYIHNILENFNVISYLLIEIYINLNNLNYLNTQEYLIHLERTEYVEYLIKKVHFLSNNNLNSL